jgi:hypothetical protein
VSMRCLPHYSKFANGSLAQTLSRFAPRPARRLTRQAKPSYDDSVALAN